MDLWEAIKERRSIRRYVQGRDVPPETVEQLLQAAIAAPSAGNRQPWHFVVVRDPETKRGLAEAAYGQRFVAQAPVVIVVCADPAQSASRYGQRGSELVLLDCRALAGEFRGHDVSGTVGLHRRAWHDSGGGRHYPGISPIYVWCYGIFKRFYFHSGHDRHVRRFRGHAQCIFGGLCL